MIVIPYDWKGAAAQAEKIHRQIGLMACKLDGSLARGYPDVRSICIVSACRGGRAPTHDAMALRRQPETGERYLNLPKWGLLA